MAKHRNNSDDDTAPITGILRKIVKLSNDNSARNNAPKVQNCRQNCGRSMDCPECAGTGTATDWS